MARLTKELLLLALLATVAFSAMSAANPTFSYTLADYSDDGFHIPIFPIVATSAGT